MKGKEILTWGQELIQKRWKILLLVLNLVVLLVLCLQYHRNTSNLIHLRYNADDLKAFTSEVSEDCFGATIDETYESALYDVIPDFYLRKGFYQYTVTWEGSAEDSFVWPHLYVDKRYNTIEQATTYLTADETSHTDNFWLNVNFNLALRLFYNGEGTATITSFEIWETAAQARMNFFFGIIALLVLDFIVFYIYREKTNPISNQKKLVFFCLLATTILSSIPIFMPGAIEGHDFRFHLCRIEGIKNAMLAGQFPVRIGTEFYKGYGYANPIFYGELLLYIPAFLRMIGFRLTTVWNIYIFGMNALTAICMYYCGKKLIKNTEISLVVTFLYVLSPYRLIDIYLRSALGEFSAMAFLPLVVAGMYRIYTEDTTKKKYRYCFLTLTLGLSGILQTHVLTGEMTGLFILITCVCLLLLTIKGKRLIQLIITVISTLLLNAWFLVPFLDYYMTENIRIVQSKLVKYLQEGGVFITQLFSLFPRWNYYPKNASDVLRAEMPLCLGLALCLGILLCVLMLFLNSGERKVRKQVLLLLLLAVLSIWMSTIYFPWDTLMERFPGQAYMLYSIQFIWRFLAIATVLASILSGFGLLLAGEHTSKAMQRILAAVLCVLTVISGIYFMEDTIYCNRVWIYNDCDEVDTMAAVSGAEYSKMTADWQTINTVADPITENGAVITGYQKNGTTVTFCVENAGQNGFVLLPLLDYKGYRASSINGQITTKNLSEGNAARVCVSFPEGFTGEVKVYFGGMWYWRVAEVVSVLSLAVLLYMAGKDRKERD